MSLEFDAANPLNQWLILAVTVMVFFVAAFIIDYLKIPVRKWQDKLLRLFLSVFQAFASTILESLLNLLDWSLTARSVGIKLIYVATMLLFFFGYLRMNFLDLYYILFMVMAISLIPSCFAAGGLNVGRAVGAPAAYFLITFMIFAFTKILVFASTQDTVQLLSVFTPKNVLSIMLSAWVTYLLTTLLDLALSKKRNRI